VLLLFWIGQLRVTGVTCDSRLTLQASMCHEIVSLGDLIREFSSQSKVQLGHEFGLARHALYVRSWGG